MDMVHAVFMSVRAYFHHRANGAKNCNMRQFRFSSSTVGGSEVGSIRRTLRRSVCVSVYMAIPDISYTRYMPL